MKNVRISLKTGQFWIMKVASFKISNPDSVDVKKSHDFYFDRKSSNQSILAIFQDKDLEIRSIWFLWGWSYDFYIPVLLELKSIIVHFIRTFPSGRISRKPFPVLVPVTLPQLYPVPSPSLNSCENSEKSRISG